MVYKPYHPRNESGLALTRLPRVWWLDELHHRLSASLTCDDSPEHATQLDTGELWRWPSIGAGPRGRSPCRSPKAATQLDRRENEQRLESVRSSCPALQCRQHRTYEESRPSCDAPETRADPVSKRLKPFGPHKVEAPRRKDVDYCGVKCSELEVIESVCEMRKRLEAVILGEYLYVPLLSVH